MIRHRSIVNPHLILGLTLFCVFWAGLQVAHSCSAHNGCSYSPAVRVDRCHIDQDRTKIELCCQSEACHRSTPLQRDLGTPSYNNEQKTSHLLIHESRVQPPQPKMGTPLIELFSATTTVLQHLNPPEVQRQSLTSLKTVVLLN